MKVSITARKFKARDTLKDFINAEVESLQKFYDELSDVEVVLSFQNNKDSLKIAEFIVKVPGQTLTATADGEEFEVAVRAAAAKIERQLEKLKAKRAAHVPLEVVPEVLDTTEEEDD